MIVTQEYCTLVPPALGFGAVPLSHGGSRAMPSSHGGLGAEPPKFFFWDVCWPTVVRTHGIGLTLECTHCISPIKESIVNRLGMVLYCIGRETVRA